MKSFLRNGMFAFLLMGLLHGFGFGQALENMDVEFCETTDKTVNYQGKSGEPIQICYNITNKGSEAQTVKIGFVDGVFTNDQRKNRACQNDGNIENFGQYVTGFTQLVTVPANSTGKQTATLTLPADKDGIVRGCLVYAFAKPGDSNGPGTSFSIQIRKAKFIDVTIGDHLAANGQINIAELKSNMSFGKFEKADGENISTDSMIRIYQDPADNKYVVQLKLVNDGDADEEVNITGVAENFLNYKETFFINRTVPRDSDLLITQKLNGTPILNLGVGFKIEHTQMIDPTTKGKTGTLSISGGGILFDKITMMIIYVAGGILLIIILSIIIGIIRKHKKGNQSVPTTIPQIVPQTVPQYTQPIQQQATQQQIPQTPIQ